MSQTNTVNRSLYIAGAWLPAFDDAVFQVQNPATGESVGVASDAGPGEAARAVSAASAAAADWRARTATERAALLLDVAHHLSNSIDDFAGMITDENGKTLAQASWEVETAVAFLRWNAEECKRAYGLTVPGSASDQRIAVQRCPVGVVAAITPWNFPLSLVVRKVAPALAAGCTMVLRPSDLTPLTAVMMIEVFEKVGLPPGVLNLITSTHAEEIGDVFLRDPRVRKVAFTGSTAVGKHLLRKAADSVKRVAMELGGHAPFLVFDDADVDASVQLLITAKSLNSGQTCTAPNRVLVHDGIYDRFCGRLVERFEQLRVGAGRETDVDIGPLISAAAVARVQEQVDDALAQGARLLTSDRSLAGVGNGGHFFRPTVLADVPTEARIMTEETFGPVLPIRRFTDEAEAIAAANDTWAGLASYVMTADLGRAQRVSEGLEFGIVGINDVRINTPQAPFGGLKESGVGCENGAAGFAEYLELKSVYLGLDA